MARCKRNGGDPYFQSLIEGFEQLGYVPGRNITLVHRFPNEKPELFTRMAAELVSLDPDVLIGVGGAAPYLKKATSTIPIIFMYVPDPVGAGLVKTIREPGGNATGLTNYSVQLSAKRLQYLKEIDPLLSRVALLINPTAKISEFYVAQSKEASPSLGLAVQEFDTRSVGELDPAFDAIVQAEMQAVVVKIARLAIARRLPTCVWVKEMVDAGSLMSYGTDQKAIARKVPVYVDKILKGAKPADLPVEEPSTYELAINLKTAGELGLAIPSIVLVQANEVIE